MPRSARHPGSAPTIADVTTTALLAGARLPATRLAAALLAAVLLAGCSLAAPEPKATPADFGGITRVLGPQGVAVTSIVSGDAGCPNKDLARTAISFSASGLDQSTPVGVHLYRFNDDAALQRNLGDVSTCARSYVTDPATFIQIVVSPYVVIGQGPWATTFTKTLTDGLRTAAASGG